MLFTERTENCFAKWTSSTACCTFKTRCWEYEAGGSGPTLLKLQQAPTQFLFYSGRHMGDVKPEDYGACRTEELQAYRASCLTHKTCSVFSNGCLFSPSGLARDLHGTADGSHYELRSFLWLYSNLPATRTKGWVVDWPKQKLAGSYEEVKLAASAAAEWDERWKQHICC